MGSDLEEGAHASAGTAPPCHLMPPDPGFVLCSPVSPNAAADPRQCVSTTASRAGLVKIAKNLAARWETWQTWCAPARPVAWAAQTAPAPQISAPQLSPCTLPAADPCPADAASVQPHPGQHDLRQPARLPLAGHQRVGLQLPAGLAAPRRRQLLCLLVRGRCRHAPLLTRCRRVRPLHCVAPGPSCMPNKWCTAGAQGSRWLPCCAGSTGRPWVRGPTTSMAWTGRMAAWPR